MKVKLPIYFNTDSTQALQNQEIDFDLDICITRIVTFYQITAIVEYFEKDIEYSQIFANGERFYSPLKVKEVEQIIENNQLQIQYKN